MDRNCKVASLLRSLVNVSVYRLVLPSIVAVTSMNTWLAPMTRPLTLNSLGMPPSGAGAGAPPKETTAVAPVTGAAVTVTLSTLTVAV